MKLGQSIRFCTSADGTRIAVASCGEGQVILRAAHWLSHVDYDLESPIWRPWLQALSARNRFVRYDPRGCGLSDRHVSDLSIEAWHADMDAVAASIEDPRFVLLGLSQGGALAIAYALRHPERVSHLVLLNAYGQGMRVRAQTEAELLEAETLVNFVRIGWGRDNPAFCQFFTNLFIPDGTPEQHRWWGDLERVTATADVAAQLLWEMQRIDVSNLAAKLRVPTLIAHCRGDMRVPFDEGCKLAAAAGPCHPARRSPAAPSAAGEFGHCALRAEQPAPHTTDQHGGDQHERPPHAPEHELGEAREIIPEEGGAARQRQQHWNAQKHRIDGHHAPLHDADGALVALQPVADPAPEIVRSRERQDSPRRRDAHRHGRSITAGRRCRPPPSRTATAAQ